MRVAETEINEFARQLLEARGAIAVAEAAQKAKAFETQNDLDQAKYWRRIESALKLMRGPRES
jgi:hypothetical protein